MRVYGHFEGQRACERLAVKYTQTNLDNAKKQQDSCLNADIFDMTRPSVRGHTVI